MSCLRFLLLFILLGIFSFPVITNAQKKELQKKIASIVQSKKTVVAVAVLGIEDRDTLTFNGNKPYPMQSVYKFPLALYILSEVDKGNFSLKQPIFITKKDLLPNTWSPLREKYPEANVSVPLSELLRYSVAQSDNNACDILFRLAGGTSKVNDYIHDLGIKEINIAATEEEMHEDWDAQFTNQARPFAIVKLLDLFYQGEVLTKSTTAFLWKIMVSTSTGKNKIKGLLPAGTVVAHKTGQSGRNKEGIRAAENDAGIVTLPDGKHYAITIFVAHSAENDETNLRMTTEVSKAVWDYFVSK